MPEGVMAIQDWLRARERLSLNPYHSVAGQEVLGDTDASASASAFVAEFASQTPLSSIEGTAFTALHAAVHNQSMLADSAAIAFDFEDFDPDDLDDDDPVFNPWSEAAS